MIEILKILVTIIGFSAVSDGTTGVNMINFDATADSPYFAGATLPGGVDTQMYTPGGASLSARYMLSGVDYAGDTCRIFIQNQGTSDTPYTTPRIVTDSRVLADLNDAELRGTIDNNDGQLTIHIYKPMTAVPQEAYGPCDTQGRLEEVWYTARSGNRKVRKRAMVYLPATYDPADVDTRYDVLYLIHGGGDNTTSFFSQDRGPLPLTNVLDHLIAQGRMRPVIVVCPTFYADDRDIGQNRMEDAIAGTRDFNIELRKYLIPAVEGRYNTYYTAKGKNAVEASRDHRAFGGFSMGSLCTWYQMAYDPAAVGTYLPLSGDLWVYDNDGNKHDAATAAQWLVDRLVDSGYNDSVRVYAYTGTEDIAYNPQKALVEQLYKHPQVFSPANMEFGVKPGGHHYYGDINEYLYHALPIIYTTTD